MEIRYNNMSYPYSTAGSFIEYVEGLTYEHVNFIFSGASHAQESSYPSSSTTSFYKSGLSEPGSTSYYQDSNGYEVNYHEQLMDEYRRHSEKSATINEQMATVRIEREGVNNVTLDSSTECPRRHHNDFNDYEVNWEDHIDPDNMTYEELLELGETVGTECRGLTQEQISSIPVSKYECGRFFFFRKKSREERCVICQMEYRRGDKRMTLPCKHAYHASCGNKWLSINKACPMCYTEVMVDVSKHK
ncbi:E3 ubiquitin-protein ligase BIG BROTHER isoform X2 [Vigna angularis]|uniref:E3 ubiquitin-protein ligase BIG BROTHER isoform X2 n=1 Tax=Phaseolus angularis TaxID=3914 RepID=UPI000809CC1A|nr:E3 ubiquitin-protein ligase BIG BROTHER isoform X2 [Vigna angularis]